MIQSSLYEHLLNKIVQVETLHERLLGKLIYINSSSIVVQTDGINYVIASSLILTLTEVV
jgi:hypothetical protein